MLISILILILCLLIFSLYSENLPEVFHKYMLWGIIGVFILICMTRPGSYVSDYLNYEKYFYSFDDKKTQIIVEATFLWLCKVVYNMGGTLRVVIYIYALLSIPLKLYAIRKMTTETLWLLTMAIYASHYFMLHDCEQIRLAAALAFGTYALYLKVEGNYWWIAFLVVGSCFHHTLSLLAIPLLICPKELGKYWKAAIFAIVPISIILWALHINVIASVPIPYFETRLKLYEVAIANGKNPDVRVLNLMTFIRIALFYYILYFYNNIKPHLKALPMLMICDAISISTWFALSSMSVIAVRFSQLFGFVEVILFASIYYTIKPAWLGKSFVGAIALYFFIQNYIYNQFGFR